MSEGFLILNRNPKQGITITVPPSTTETKVQVCSLGVSGRQTKLGFKASSNVKVLRDELIERDQKAAQEKVEKLWAVHVKGPDSVLPTSSKADAIFRSGKLNKDFEEIHKSLDPKYAPTLEAEVIEWAGTPEAHAERLKDGVDWSDLG
ncbi:carbon storage regulator [Marinomonas spartinae]|uniref:carbon storage regulator n=1 Tax=Marinomonas spartinae TaxID=1792290 RepID=UPI0018F12DD6|nr:carbon storage regulator [Marinomonas spartinae]MBJ7555424.1 carbon storage regulator [Marinomonas spartinae]